MEEKSPKQLRDEALETIKERKRFTWSNWDRFLLSVEAHFKNYTCCPKSKFMRIVGDGMVQIKSELNIYNYLKKARLVDAMSKHLLTFNERRLILHQADTSFLLTPRSPPKDDGKDRIPPLTIDDTESEEDFGFIKENDTLDLQT